MVVKIMPRRYYYQDYRIRPAQSTPLIHTPNPHRTVKIMHTYRLNILLLLASLPLLVIAGCSASEGNDRHMVDASMCDEDNGGLVLPEGFCAGVVADSVGSTRHIVVDADEDIYVIHRRVTDGGGITALRDTDKDGKADSMHSFGAIAGTGLELNNGYLYATTDTSVYRFAFDGDELAPMSEPERIVEGFPAQVQHASKAIAFDSEGHLYVNVGAPSNACQETMRSPGSPGADPCPQLERSSGVWRFDATTAGQSQEADGHHFSTGIRNGLAMAWHSGAGSIYVVQHGRDQLNTLWPEYYTDEQNAELPAEEMFRLYDGSDFGWPYCYYDHQQEMKLLSPEYGGDGAKVGRCADTEAPMAAFPGHYAPNDLVFNTQEHFPAHYANGAFVAFHGSWNRAPLPQEGYTVAFVPMDASGEPAGDWEIFADGFKGADILASPGDAVYRPMGLAFGPHGSLYVSDSRKGRIWRIVYKGME